MLIFVLFGENWGAHTLLSYLVACKIRCCPIKLSPILATQACCSILKLYYFTQNKTKIIFHEFGHSFFEIVNDSRYIH
jgi:hypothetical protein